MNAAGGDPAGAQPTEEELRAYEAELRKIRVEHVLLEHIVTLINLGMRRTGLAPGTESEREPEQVRLAVEGVRALLPLIEQAAPEQAVPIRDALSRLQLAFVRIGGQPGPGGGEEASGEAATDPAPGGARDPGPSGSQPPPDPTSPGASSGEPGPAQRSGRLWVPGQ